MGATLRKKGLRNSRVLRMLKQTSNTNYLLSASLLLVLILMSCAKPLTDNEESFFHNLENACRCQVSREYDEEATADFRGGPGWYKLILRYDDYDQRIDSDSLKIMSLKLAYELHEFALTKVEYPYNEINVWFVFNEGQSREHIETFMHQYNNHERFYPY